jgi:hypothetical protein
MKVRTATPFALILASALGASAAQAQFSYAPGTQKYRVSSNQKISVEAMGQKNEMETGSQQVVTVTLAPQTKDTLSLALTLDSITVTQLIPGMPDPSGMKGAKATALLSPAGKVYSTKAPEGVPGAEQLGEMARFLPSIRGGLAVGATWTDTSSRKQNTGGVDVELTAVTTSKVVGEETVDGEKTWKIERTGTTKLAGSGNAQGQPISLEGTIASTGFVFVSPKGLYVKSESKDDIKQKITLVANGMEIAQNIMSTTTVDRVK